LNSSKKSTQPQNHNWSALKDISKALFFGFGLGLGDNGPISPFNLVQAKK
jgi:hypothetical protein